MNPRLTIWIVYILGFASCCPWPYQSHAFTLFMILSAIGVVICMSMLFDPEGVLDKISTGLKKSDRLQQIEMISEENQKKFARQISWNFMPMILMLVINGIIMPAAVWIFMYIVMMRFGKMSIERLKEKLKNGTPS